MCGIVGYTGEASATPILVEGLTRMEYRGYDSAGVAVEQDGGIQVITRKGKVAELAHTLGHFEMTGTCGIGHTRWATHGKPSEANAHPHTSCSGDIAVVQTNEDKYKLLRDGIPVETPAAEVKVGDILRIRVGDRVPLVGPVTPRNAQHGAPAFTGAIVGQHRQLLPHHQ